jgi:hypothetical protein
MPAVSSIQNLVSFSPVQILFSMGMPKSIGAILIDAFSIEDHHSAVIVTDYPVEDGSTISDNAIEQPDDLTITGICGTASLLNPVSMISRALDADQALYNLKHNRDTITILSGLRVYQNMIITDYRVRRDKDSGGALVFVMSFRQIVIVKSQTTTVPNIGGSDMVQKQGDPGLNAGPQNGSPVDPGSPLASTVQFNPAEAWNAGIINQAPAAGTTFLP